MTGTFSFADGDYDPTTGVDATRSGSGWGRGTDYQFVSGNPVDLTDPSGLDDAKLTPAEHSLLLEI